jgi:hypothetical protein
VSNRDVQRVAENQLDLVEGSAPSRAENQRLGIVEGLAPSETEEEPTSSVNIRRAGNVRTPATRDSLPHRREEKNEGSLWMMVRT